MFSISVKCEQNVTTFSIFTHLGSGEFIVFKFLLKIIKHFCMSNYLIILPMIKALHLLKKYKDVHFTNV